MDITVDQWWYYIRGNCKAGAANFISLKSWPQVYTEWETVQVSWDISWDISRFKEFGTYYAQYLFLSSFNRTTKRLLYISYRKLSYIICVKVMFQKVTWSIRMCNSPLTLYRFSCAASFLPFVWQTWWLTRSFWSHLWLTSLMLMQNKPVKDLHGWNWI